MATPPKSRPNKADSSLGVGDGADHERRELEVVDEPNVIEAEILGRDETTGRVLIKISQNSGTHFSGPLPPPDLLKEYEQVVPGLSKTIVRVFETQTKHRISTEAQILKAEIEDTKRGQMFGLTAFIALLFSAVFCAYLDQPIVASAMVGAAAVGIITAFIKGRGNAPEVSQTLPVTDDRKTADDQTSPHHP